MGSDFPVNRRGALGVMGAAAGLAAAAALPARAGDAPPIQAFLDAASKLAGITLDRSYDQLAGDYWSILTLHGDDDLRRLVALVQATPEAALAQALDQAGLTARARQVLSLWYTGMIQVSPADFANPVVRRLCGDLARAADPAHPDQPVNAVVTYDEALTWRACTFTKPSATCGGPFGYWFNPPA